MKDQRESLIHQIDPIILELTNNSSIFKGKHDLEYLFY